MEVNYGKELREERKRLRLRQEDVANVLGFSRELVSYIERGKREVRVVELHALYRQLGMDVGFGRIFKWIDGKNEQLLRKIEDSEECFTENECQVVMHKNYAKMSIITLEKIQRLIYIRRPTAITETSVLVHVTDDEAERLKMILDEYLKQDGNIERALQLLKIAIK